MGIALLTLSTLFQQLQVRPVRRSPFMRPPAATAPTVRVRAAAPLHDAAMHSRPEAIAPGVAVCGANAARPLRVVQVTDTASRSGTFGRVLMSGRMADVCAELERLSALEERRALH